MNDFPSSVTISGHTFHIQWKDKEWFMDTESFGQIIFSTLRICVCNELPLSQVKDALLHEILHAIYSVRYLKENSCEEDVVCNVASELIAITSDPRNSAITNFLFG